MTHHFLVVHPSGGRRRYESGIADYGFIERSTGSWLDGTGEPE